MNITSLTCTVYHFLILLLLAISGVKSSNDEMTDIKRSDFPRGFLFGTSTSAYQIEGAFLEDGKSLSNWDVFCRVKGSISDGSNGDVADDHYHRYMEDIELMHSLGVNAYRFSISWSRVLPRGKFGGVNHVGINFYNNIVDNLLLRGIEPFVTIHHSDYPQELEDKYGAWLSPLMQEEFVHFAETCFQYFGDRVKYWLTINEPNLSAELAYETAYFPPARCSPPFGHCANGNSDVEPLIAVHNMLMAHAKAAKSYRKNFKTIVDGMIGITVSAYMYVPLGDDRDDKEAAKRALAFHTAWILDPLVFGEYPQEMKRVLGSQLPKISSEESMLLRDSIDFIGINHYATLYAKDCMHSNCTSDDSGCSAGSNRPIRGFVCTTGHRNGNSIGEPTGSPTLFVVPRGIEDIIMYIKERYHNKQMFVTENGYSPPATEDDNDHNDVKRISFHKSYLEHLGQAIRNGADVRGYFIWSVMDNFEWTSGYNVKYGLYSIDPLTLDRIPKLSARWFRDFLTSNNLSHIHEELSHRIVDHNQNHVSGVQSQ